MKDREDRSREEEKRLRLYTNLLKDFDYFILQFESYLQARVLSRLFVLSISPSIPVT